MNDRRIRFRPSKRRRVTKAKRAMEAHRAELVEIEVLESLAPAKIVYDRTSGKGKISANLRHYLESPPQFPTNICGDSISAQN